MAARCSIDGVEATDAGPAAVEAAAAAAAAASPPRLNFVFILDFLYCCLSHKTGGLKIVR